MSEPLVLLDAPRPGIARVTLNRPRARNALSLALVAELRRVLAELAADDGPRAVIVTGAGGAFCAGADLIERGTLSAAARTAHTTAILAAIEEVAALPMPTIAAIDGYALAGGAELALACDLRFGSPTATLGFPEVRIGIFPGAGGVLRLPRLVGLALANDLLFTGRRIGADEALRGGLLNALMPAGELMEAVLAKAGEVAQSAPLAVRAVKRALRAADGLSPADAAAVVQGHRVPLDATEDYAEGLAAFAEKRAPVWRGR